MHQDKKREERQQKEEFEQLQQEESFEQEEVQQSTQDENIEEKEKLQPIENEMERAKKRRREVVFEMALFFVLGVLLGVTMKTEAIKKITIGFNDYQISKPLESYNIADLKKKLDDQIAEQQQMQLESQNQPQQ
ncbi:MAG: hypothetical protein US70_C0022G0028 [Parcubacteria group bacterium GW2011_GWD2_38_11]|nr:MAG: hypothetical protein US70_C0022G0028 [Parcubacteria group bacterium GW2011_GWD2_38_11]